MVMIEKVKRVLEKHITLHSIRQGYGVFNITSFDAIAGDICQLFDAELAQEKAECQPTKVEDLV